MANDEKVEIQWGEAIISIPTQELNESLEQARERELEAYLRAKKLAKERGLE